MDRKGRDRKENQAPVVVSFWTRASCERTPCVHGYPSPQARRVGPAPGWPRLGPRPDPPASMDATATARKCNHRPEKATDASTRLQNKSERKQRTYEPGPSPSAHATSRDRTGPPPTPSRRMTWRSWPPIFAGSVESTTDATDRTETWASWVPPPDLNVMYVPLVGMGKVVGGMDSSATDSSTAYKQKTRRVAWGQERATQKNEDARGRPKAGRGTRAQAVSGNTTGHIDGGSRARREMSQAAEAEGRHRHW